MKTHVRHRDPKNDRLLVWQMIGNSLNLISRTALARLHISDTASILSQRRSFARRTRYKGF